MSQPARTALRRDASEGSHARSKPSPRSRIRPSTGAIRKAAQATGAELRISAGDRQGRIRASTRTLSATTSSATRPVPVHRADLARDPEAGGAGARLRPLRRRDHADAVRPLRGAPTRRCAREIMTLRNDPTANAAMAGAFTQQQRRHALPSGSAARRPRASSTSRISSAPAGAARLITLGRQQSRTPRRRTSFRARRAPTARSSTTGRAARAAPPTSMRRAGRPLRGRARRSRAPAIAAARPPPTVRPAAAAAMQRRRALRRRRSATAPRRPRREYADGRAGGVGHRASADAASGMFHSLVPTGERRAAVAPVVSELWRAGATNAAQPRPRRIAARGRDPARRTARTGCRRVGAPLDLFQRCRAPARGAVGRRGGI